MDEHVMYCEMGTELGLHVQMCLFVHACVFTGIICTRVQMCIWQVQDCEPVCTYT